MTTNHKVKALAHQQAEHLGIPYTQALRMVEYAVEHTSIKVLPDGIDVDVVMYLGNGADLNYIPKHYQIRAGQPGLGETGVSLIRDIVPGLIQDGSTIDPIGSGVDSDTGELVISLLTPDGTLDRVSLMGLAAV